MNDLKIYNSKNNYSVNQSHSQLKKNSSLKANKKVTIKNQKLLIDSSNIIES